MNSYSYTPLSLQDLCINTILLQYWNKHFESTILYLPHPYWQTKIKKRHEIIKICL